MQPCLVGLRQSRAVYLVAAHNPVLIINGCPQSFKGTYHRPFTHHTGGTAVGTPNVISGNIQEGVFIGDAATTGNIILGNFIGTDVTGTLDRGNLDDGVQLAGCDNNIIGGTALNAGNVISGNDDDGIDFTGAATNNRIEGNRIGTNAAGLADIPNSSDNINIKQASTDNIVGGTAGGARNIISGAGRYGILLDGAGTVCWARGRSE